MTFKYEIGRLYKIVNEPKSWERYYNTLPDASSKGWRKTINKDDIIQKNDIILILSPISCFNLSGYNCSFIKILHEGKLKYICIRFQSLDMNADLTETDIRKIPNDQKSI